MATGNTLSKALRMAIIVLVLFSIDIHLKLTSFYYTNTQELPSTEVDALGVDMNILNSSIAIGTETATHHQRKYLANAERRSIPAFLRWKSPEDLHIESHAPGMRMPRKKRPTKKETQDQEVRSQVKLERPLNNTSLLNTTLLPSDAYYQQERGTASWDLAPIVIPEYKLLFFTIPKAGCTVFKQLFRRMAQCPDWRTHSTSLPHNPSHNNLTYLSDYDVDDALHIMTSDEWTRAVFVRHPMNRIISAYLNKAVRHDYAGGNLSYVTKRCCPRRKGCGLAAQRSFQKFLYVAHECSDLHWACQSKRVHQQYWPYINFVGHLETAQADAKALLERVGAWETYGATGWGANGTEPIFASKSTILHTTNPHDKLREFCRKDSVVLVQALYADDYRHPLFGFHDNGICSKPR